jgi:hypothetical protein
MRREPNPNGSATTPPYPKPTLADPASVHGDEHDFLTNASSAGTYPTQPKESANQEDRNRKEKEMHIISLIFVCWHLCSTSTIILRVGRKSQRKRSVNDLFRKFSSHIPWMIDK